MGKRGIENLKKIERRHCNRCKTATRHSLIIKKIRYEADDFMGNGEPTWINTFVNAVWKCEGCETFTIEERYGNDVEFPDGRWESRLYPKRNHRDIAPKHFLQLPPKLSVIYQEALIAFNSGAPILAAVGLRGLIEGICKNRGIVGKTLENKIDGLTKDLPANIVANLHGLRYMGNDATHDLTPPKPHEIRLGIEICEDLLNFLYELDYKTARLGKRKKVVPTATATMAKSKSS